MLTGSMGDSLIKDTLKNLSCNNGWSYGVFWRFDQKNSLLLTLQDLYCEEQMGVVIDDMLLQVHILGQGVIGEAAFTKTHRWMFADSHFGKPSPVGSIQSSLDDFQDHFEFDTQFSVGIKTIVVISVEPLGVVQFGSTQKFAERLDFVNQTKEHFQSIEILQGLALPENELMSLSSDAWDASSGLFASLISCESPNFECPTLQQGLTREDFNETGFSAENVTGCSNLQHHQSLVESGSFIELLPSEGPCNSIWNNFNVQESSIMNSTCKSELLVDMVKTSPRFCESTVSNQNFGPLPHSSKNQLKMPSSLCTFDELFPKIDFLEALPNHDKNDDLLQWFSPTTDKSNEMITAKLRNDLSLTSEVVTLSSDPKAHQAPTKVISDKQPSPSVQSSVTNVLNSGQKEKYSDIVGVDKQFDCSAVDKRSKSFEDWEDTVKPVDIGGHLDFSVSSPDCISEQCIDSKFKTSKTLFSKLGLHQRLDEVYRGSCTAARSDFKDQLFSTVKRRKIESPLLSSSEVSCLTRFVGSVNSLQPANHLNSTSNFELKDKVIRKLETGSCVGDSCSIIAGNTVSSPKKLDQPTKTIKKKAKPGTKPRPKDRQQIHDRLLELRDLIPNCEKMSIDRLLLLTIKHLFFLQSVARHAKRFDQTEEPKSGMVQKENPKSSNGVTWACEVGDQTMFCPLIIEDLTVPGQMLIVILCEEQGFFLEIVDIIRGFGLTILKGVMEIRDTKIWARFTVEAEENRHVSRHEIFSSLVQLLPLTSTTGVDKSDQLDNVIDGGASVFNSCQQSALSLPVRLGTC